MSKTISQAELDEIVAKYRPVITFKVKKSLGSRTPDWEDVVNEVLLNVVEKLKKGDFRGDSSVGTYIYTITSRRIIDFIRQKSKVLKHAPEPDPFRSPLSLIENKEKAEVLGEAIAKLKPKYKEVLYLYYFKEMGRKEVAARLGIPPRRVSERVNYAQTLLKKALQK
jgi:RNA polymerase sigma-70 factor (ECF subfamily)